MGTAATREEWSPSKSFRSVERLTTWLMLLGVIAGLGAGIAAGAGVYTTANTKGAGIAVGVVAGVLTGLVVMTPYLVVVAGLNMLNAISERISWLADFLYEQSGAADE